MVLRCSPVEVIAADEHLVAPPVHFLQPRASQIGGNHYVNKPHSFPESNPPLRNKRRKGDCYRPLKVKFRISSMADSGHPRRISLGGAQKKNESNTAAKDKRPEIYLSLSKEEIDQDFMLLTGVRPLRSQRKRAEYLQKEHCISLNGAKKNARNTAGKEKRRESRLSPSKEKKGTKKKRPQFQLLPCEEKKAGNSTMKEKRPEFYLPLSKEEIENDFILMTGMKPPRGQKMRFRAIQAERENLFPGSNLSKRVTSSQYRVPMSYWDFLK